MALGDRFHKPPPPSLPREAPWRELEELIDVLKNVSSKLDALLSNAPTAPIRPAAPAPLDNLFKKLDDFIKRIGELATPSLPFGIVGKIDDIAASTRNHKTWAHGTKKVTIAGQAEQLPDVKVPDGVYLVVRAKPANTDNIYLGNSITSATRETSRITLSAGEAKKLRVQNANVYFVDAVVPDEGVEYFVEQD